MAGMAKEIEVGKTALSSDFPLDTGISVGKRLREIRAIRGL
jgi:hypothetical protein